MLLVIDIGNSNITCGIFQDGILQTRFCLESDKKLDKLSYEKLIKKYIGTCDIKDCAIASVVDELTERIYCAIQNAYQIKPTMITSDLCKDISSKNIEHIGIDRIANAYAAARIYSSPVIVVDVGTATTFEVINKSSKFIGGVILPGPKTQLESLYLNTSKLPDIDINDTLNTKFDININTKNAIQTGVILGHAYAIEGFIKSCKHELGEKTVVVGTGGGAVSIAKFLKEQKFDAINENLTLEGIRMLFEARNH